MIAVLKTIGIVLLCLLGFVILVLLMILLIPVRYQGNAKYQEKFTAEAIAGWLFRLIGYRAVYDGNIRHGMILFGRVRKEQVIELDQKEEAPRDPLNPDDDFEEDVANHPDDFADYPETSPPAENAVEEPEVTDSGENIDIVIEAEQPEGESGTGAEKAEEESGSGPEKAEGQSGSGAEQTEGEADTEADQAENPASENENFVRLKKIWKLLQDEKNQKAKDLVFDRLGKILKHIFPKKLTGHLDFGCEDPADTGYILAGLACIYPLVGDHCKVTPSFEKKMLDFDLTFRGRIMIGYCLWNLAFVWFDKDFRRLLCQIKSSSL